DADEVRALLDDAARLPSGAPAVDGGAAIPGLVLGAETKSTSGERLPSDAKETGEVGPHAQCEPDSSVKPEVPAVPGTAVAVEAPAQQDTQQTDKPSTPELGSFGAENFVSQHALRPARDLHPVVDPYPRVLIAILAKQKERPLPLFLSCIEGLDYPKSAIFLYIRTNNNTDGTEQILREWVERVDPSYAGVEFDAAPVEH